MIYYENDSNEVDEDYIIKFFFQMDSIVKLLNRSYDCRSSNYMMINYRSTNNKMEDMNNCCLYI